MTTDQPDPNRVAGAPDHPNSPIPNRAKSWKLKTRTLTFNQSPLIMGIVNVTPDSFSDGGKFSNTNTAVEHALSLAQQGASILDIGGESTRPYSTPVAVNEELERVIPVIEKVAKSTSIPISIDTSKSEVALAAIEAGAEIINDVTGLEGDPKMIDVAVQTQAGICAMHMKGNPQNMQDDPQYHDVVREIHAYLAKRKSFLLNAGIELERICLDPGVGFGKTHEHNWQLIRSCEQYHDLGCPLLIGHSRKGFIGKIVDGHSSPIANPQSSPHSVDGTNEAKIPDKELQARKISDRDAGTLAITLSLAQKGIQIIRVHEVANTIAALNIQRKI